MLLVGMWINTASRKGNWSTSSKITMSTNFSIQQSYFWKSNPKVNNKITIWHIYRAFTDRFLLARLQTINVWLFSSAPTSFPTLWKLAGCPPILFNSDPNHLEVAPNPQVNGSVPQHCPHFRCQSQAASTCTSDWPAIIYGFTGAPPQVW